MFDFTKRKICMANDAINRSKTKDWKMFAMPVIKSPG